MSCDFDQSCSQNRRHFRRAASEIDLTKRRTASLCVAVLALLSLSCSPDSSTNVAPAAVSESTTTVGTTDRPPANATDNSVVVVDANDATAYDRLLLLLEDAGIPWSISQADTFEIASNLCTNVSGSTSVEQLTGIALADWSRDINATSQDWENLKGLYAAATTVYCPSWSLAATAIGQESAESEAFVRARVDADAGSFVLVLASQDPRSAAIFLDHLPISDFLTSQLSLLLEQHREEAVAISAAVDELGF